jgi:hypothetical protein
MSMYCYGKSTHSTDNNSKKLLYIRHFEVYFIFKGNGGIGPNNEPFMKRKEKAPCQESQ